MAAADAACMTLASSAFFHGLGVLFRLVQGKWRASDQILLVLSKQTWSGES